MSTQSIEFATNSSNHWFVVSYDWTQCTEILAQARKMGVMPSAPRKYTHPNTRWIVYFNSGVNEQFMKWVRTTFTVKNVERIVGAMRAEAALKYENSVYCQRANISRYSLSEVKSAMIKVIGTPAEIKEFFSLYNIKVNGAAGLPQCLQLIEELDKFDEVLAELRKPKVEVPTYTPEVIVDPFEIPFECDVDMDSPEFSTFIDAAIKQMTLALPPAAQPVDFEPWTTQELAAYTVKEIKKLAEMDGISLTGTSKMKKSDLIRYILPALNAAALAAHLT